MVCVEEMEDLAKGGGAPGVFEDFGVEVGGVVFAEAEGDLNFAVDDVAFLYVAAEESDDDGGGCGGGCCW